MKKSMASGQYFVTPSSMGPSEAVIRSDRLREMLPVPQHGMMSQVSARKVVVSTGIGGAGGIQQVRRLESFSQNVEVLSAIAASTAAITVFHFVLGPKFSRTPWIVSIVELIIRPNLLNSCMLLSDPDNGPLQESSFHLRSG